MRLSRCILLLSLLFSTVALFGQSKLDSLKDSLNVARRKNDRKGVASFLSKIGYHYNTSLQLYDSALYYYKASISPANFSTNDALNASTYNGIGSVYQRKAFPDSAIRYYNLALELYQKIKDIENSTAVKVNLSIIYKQIGQYDKGLEIALDALDHLEKKKPDNYLAICYNTIGSIYLKTNEYKNALVFFNV